MTYWFTSDRGDWEIRWCKRCGALQKFNIVTQKKEWVFPHWAQEFKEAIRHKSSRINKSKTSKKKVKK